MNPLAIGLAIMVGIASFFSYTSDWLEKNVKAGNWNKENAQAWDAARNLRPCFGPHDPACPYHDAEKVR